MDQDTVLSTEQVLELLNKGCLSKPEILHTIKGLLDQTQNMAVPLITYLESKEDQAVIVFSNPYWSSDLRQICCFIADNLDFETIFAPETDRLGIAVSFYKGRCE
jgi:hypothetical protein